MSLFFPVLVENVIATTDIPQYPTSIVDGYAVGAPCESGVYPIVGRIYTDTKPYDGNGIQVGLWLIRGRLDEEGYSSSLVCCLQ